MIRIESTNEELQALANLIDAAIRWHGQGATQGGLQSVGHVLSGMQMAQTWAMKIEEAMKSPEPGA